MALQNAFEDLALDSTLQDILTELGQKLESGGTVELSSSSLAALESITATVANWPGDFPDAATLAKLEQIRVLLAGTLTVNGTVSVNEPISIDDNGASITVDGPLTDTELRATPVSVDGSVVTESAEAANADIDRIATSTTSILLLAANANRKGFIIVNDSSNRILYVKFGTTATSTDYTVRLTAGQTYESPANPMYTGRIDGILDAGTAFAQVTELTA